MAKQKTVPQPKINSKKSIKPRPGPSDTVADEDRQLDDAERFDSNGVRSVDDMERARSDTDIERA